MDPGGQALRRRPDGQEVSAQSTGVVRGTLRRHGPATRAELVALTGLSRATVSAVVQSLLRAGEAQEEREAARTELGRPASVVRLNPSRADVVGLEVGRGHVAAAAADAADGFIGGVTRPASEGSTVLQRASAAVDLLEEFAVTRGVDLRHVRGVAVGTPGPRFTGGLRPSSDLALARTAAERAEVVELLTRRFGPAVIEVDNNTRCTALGEATSGVAVGVRNMLYLRVDEGIGGGVVSGGALLEGAWGVAGEFGHVVVEPAGQRCRCGGRGCLELVAAMPAILGSTGAGSRAALAEGLSRGLFQAEFERAARAVAQVLAGALALLDSSVVVLGGSVARLPGFLARVEAGLVDLCPSWCLADLSVRAAEDDRTAGARGCLVRARTRVDGDAPAAP